MSNDKVVILTGATKGIGKAIAEQFAHENAIIYGLGRNKEALNNIEQLSSKMHPICVDINQIDSLKAIVQSIYKEHGHIDILINNAGVMNDSLIGMITSDQMETMFKTNVYAPIELTQLVVRFMKRQKAGCIVNIGSIIGMEGNAGQSVYSATKGALISFTKSAAKELASDGIRVNAVAPGIVQTDLLNNVPQAKLQERISQIKLGRVATPQDIASVVYFLCSEHAKYITGQIIKVDGLTII